MHEDGSRLFPNCRVAIEWYRNNNPARAKPLNLLEPERAHSTAERFGDLSAEDVFVSICQGLTKVLKQTKASYFTRGQNAVDSFGLCVLGLNSDPIHPDDAAPLLRATPHQVTHWLQTIWTSLEAEFKRRRIID